MYDSLSIPTWDTLLYPLGFLLLVLCLLTWRPIRAAWWGAMVVLLYVSMFATIVAGFVCGLGWAVPLEPLRGIIEEASVTVGQMISADSGAIRPWVFLAMTAVAVVAHLVVIQLACVGTRLGALCRVLRRLRTGEEDAASEPPVRASGPDKPAPRDDIQTAREGLGSLVRRSGPRSTQSLHKWLQA